MDFKDVVFVRPLSEFKLLLEFEGGEYRLFDFKAYSVSKSGLVEEIASSEYLFKSVKLDATGTICWDNDFDLSIEYLYTMSTLLSELSSVI